MQVKILYDWGPFQDDSSVVDEHDFAAFEGRIAEWLANGWELVGPVSCGVHRIYDYAGDPHENYHIFATLIKR